MQVQRSSVKLFLDPPGVLDAGALIPVFHEWIRESRVEGLLIDVADYRHVEGGPGVVLVGHDGDYRVDAQRGRTGLCYVDKQRLGGEGGGGGDGNDGDWEARVPDLLRRALIGCRALERDRRVPGVRFRTDELRIRLLDRLHAQNNEVTAQALAKAVETLLARIFAPAPVSVEWEDGQDARRALSLLVRAPGAPDLETLIERLDAESTAPAPEPQQSVAPVPPVPDDVRLPTALGRRLGEWARDRYPHEACGLLVGRVRGEAVHIEHITQARNLETERAADRFVLDPGDFVSADNEARRRGLEIVGIWHTHPDHPARPSKTDLEWAWEGYSYVIVSVSRDGIDAVRSWRLDGKQFTEQSIEETP